MPLTSLCRALSTKRRNSTKTFYTLYHLDSERGLRGGERQLLYLARYLQSQGHENVVVCRRGSALDSESKRLGLKTLHLPFFGEWDPVSAAILRSAASRAKYPAIFHAHTGHTASLASLASRFCGPPRVVHRRVDFKLSRDWSRRLKYDSADAVIAVSEAIRDLLIRQKVPASKVRIIHDCIPITDEETRTAGSFQRFLPASPEERKRIREKLGTEWNIPHDAVWVGNMAAMVPHKDQANLLKAMTVVRSQAGRAHLFLIGEGPLRRSLENLSRQLGLTPRVHFVGQQADPVSWLQALDLFVLPSWGEGMGSVLLEAMACGLPIVATTAGGIAEVIARKEHSILVPPRDSESLGHAIIEALRHSAGNGSSRRDENYLTKFSLTQCGKQVEEIYEGLVKS